MQFTTVEFPFDSLFKNKAQKTPHPICSTLGLLFLFNKSTFAFCYSSLLAFARASAFSSLSMSNSVLVRYTKGATKASNIPKAFSTSSSVGIIMISRTRYLFCKGWGLWGGSDLLFLLVPDVGEWQPTMELFFQRTEDQRLRQSYYLVSSTRRMYREYIPTVYTLQEYGR